MSSLFGPSFTYTPPAPVAPAAAVFDAQAAIRDVREDARAARAASKGAGQAAPAPAMSVQTIGGYTTAYSMSSALQNLLHSLGSFLSGLLPAPAPAQPTKPGKPPKPTPAPTPSKGATDFKLSSFNILGSNHTAPGGNNKGYASGVERTRMAVQVLRDQHLDVVGFQEMKNDQAREFKRLAGGDYGLFPGDIKRNLGSDNSIAWRKDTWDLVDSQILDMPSHLGRNQPSPLVRLRNKQTGQEVYFLNIHNAPGYHIGGAQQQWRDKATAQQVALVNKLRDQTGLPIVVTGDFNDKAKAFSTMTQQAGLHAANQAPGGRMPRAMTLDWLFGSKAIDFSHYTRLAKGIHGRITDHSVLVSDVHIDKGA